LRKPDLTDHIEVIYTDARQNLDVNTEFPFVFYEVRDKKTGVQRRVQVTLIDGPDPGFDPVSCKVEEVPFEYTPTAEVVSTERRDGFDLVTLAVYAPKTGGDYGFENSDRTLSPDTLERAARIARENIGYRELAAEVRRYILENGRTECWSSRPMFDVPILNRVQVKEPVSKVMDFKLPDGRSISVSTLVNGFTYPEIHPTGTSVGDPEFDSMFFLKPENPGYRGTLKQIAQVAGIDE